VASRLVGDPFFRVEGGRGSGGGGRWTRPWGRGVHGLTLLPPSHSVAAARGGGHLRGTTTRTVTLPRPLPTGHWQGAARRLAAPRRRRCAQSPRRAQGGPNGHLSTARATGRVRRLHACSPASGFIGLPAAASIAACVAAQAEPNFNVILFAPLRRPQLLQTRAKWISPGSQASPTPCWVLLSLRPPP